MSLKTTVPFTEREVREMEIGSGRKLIKSGDSKETFGCLP